MSLSETARAKMIESQLRPNRVTDERVIEAFSRLRRELFVPEHLRGVAYVDEDLPLGRGRYLVEPMVAARLLQALMPDRKESALVLGAGVGYEAALLALLTRSVIALEDDEELARLGGAALVDHRIASVICVETPPAAGHRPRAPYDMILFGGAAAEIPSEIAAQLAEGGRMAPVSGAPLLRRALAECSRIALSLTPQRRYFRVLPRSLSLSSEGSMPQPRGSKKQRLLRAGAILAIAAAAAFAAPPASAQTLTEAFAYAYNNNPQILAQRALLRASDEQVPQALSNWRPVVTLTGNAGFERLGVASTGTRTVFGSFPTRSLDLRITQPIYRGGRTEAATRQAINTVQSTRAQTLGVETTVFQAVALAYLDVVRDQTLVEVNRNNEQVLRRQLEATQDRFRVGEGTRP